jgi:hypothetical protein
MEDAEEGAAYRYDEVEVIEGMTPHTDGGVTS